MGRTINNFLKLAKFKKKNDRTFLFMIKHQVVKIKEQTKKITILIK